MPSFLGEGGAAVSSSDTKAQERGARNEGRTWSPEARALSGDLGLGTAVPVPGCVRLGKEFNLVDPEFLLL